MITRNDIIEMIVEETVEFAFGDWPEGHGIGTSDVSICVNNAMQRVCDRFPDADLSLSYIWFLVNTEIGRITGE